MTPTNKGYVVLLPFLKEVVTRSHPNTNVTSNGKRYLAKLREIVDNAIVMANITEWVYRN